MIAEQQAVIAEQRATITQLQERVRDLETRVGQHSGNSSRPPSSDLPGTPKRPPSRPSGRGRGGQPGHVAHQRAMAPPERVDVVTDHWPLRCQACNTVLPQAPGLPGVAGAPDFVAYQATEFAAIHPRITEYRLYRLACPLCGTRTWASLRTYQDRTRQMQSGFGELLTQGIGSADLRVRRMCEGVDYLWPALWTYLDVPGVEPTNNVAERAIRPAGVPSFGARGVSARSPGVVHGLPVPCCRSRRPAGCTAWTCSPIWPRSAPRAWPAMPSPRSSPPSPDPRLPSGCTGRGRTSHQLRVPN